MIASRMPIDIEPARFGRTGCGPCIVGVVDAVRDEGDLVEVARGYSIDAPDFIASGGLLAPARPGGWIMATTARCQA